MISIVWHRLDLRVEDNPALLAADGGEVIPCFIFEDLGENFSLGAASKWWLHHSLSVLEAKYSSLGLQLLYREGDSLEELRDLIAVSAASAVYWNRRYEPWAMKRDEKVKAALKDDGVEVKSFNGSLLREPWEIQNKQGRPYQVYTPFSKAVMSEEMRSPKGGVSSVSAPKKKLSSLSLDDLGLLPTIAWDTHFTDVWTPGSAGAHQALESFSKKALSDYDEGRNIPSVHGTSRLSPHLHFGEISPLEVWKKIRPIQTDGTHTYLKEIVWREFAYHLLYHFPETPWQPLKEEFRDFPWEQDSKALLAWQKGETHCPIVDAGMRELWTTGWMHNRVRMIVGSFLVKHLLIPWQEGAQWFWDTLVDADLASNTLGWQWVAGCGADAAPYFRVFNPVLQGEKFDPQGDYVRHWIPELKDVPDKFVHKPWEYSLDYPKPIVDIKEGRQRALSAYEKFKQKKPK